VLCPAFYALEGLMPTSLPRSWFSLRLSGLRADVSPLARQCGHPFMDNELRALTLEPAAFWAATSTSALIQ